jgi:putative endonuclease
MHTKGGYVYLLTNKTDNVIYTGVTNDLQKRIYEHKQSLIKGFTSKYNTNKLVYYEAFDDIESAISREKQIKSGSRQKKISLIESINPGYKDLYPEL